MNTGKYLSYEKQARIIAILEMVRENFIWICRGFDFGVQKFCLLKPF